MKIAHMENGEPIEASANSPEEAICPWCGGVVVLRHRRSMNRKAITYYWRHRSNRNTNCRARQRPVA